MAKASVTSVPKAKARVVDVGVTDAKQLKGTSLVVVKATDQGYYGHRIRAIGEVFEMRMTEGTLPAWVVKASPKAVQKFEAAKEEPEPEVEEEESESVSDDKVI